MTFDVARWLRGRLRGGPVYVRIRRRELWVRDTSRPADWRDLACVALDRERATIVAFGADAEDAVRRDPRGHELVRPFDHPRSILNDFIVAEKLLRHALRSLFQAHLLRPAPVMLIHPLECLEGGLTAVERRALQELAAGAGARQALLRVGRELRDSEVGLEEFTISA